MKFPCYFLFVTLIVSIQSEQKCTPRDYGNGGTVCVCNENHCDTFPPLEKVPSTQFAIYSSNKAGKRFEKATGEFENGFQSNASTVVINRHRKYQKINGWGGGFTDATGINLESLNKRTRDHLIRSYFSEDGLEYSLCRVPIGGTDFSTHGYSYDDTDDNEEDLDLNNFKLAPEDYQYKLPYIKEALKLRKGQLNFFASAWTAPKWMKTNRQYSGFGFLKKDMYQAWADYHVRFLDSYKKEGITFWGITTGNEPSLSLVGSKINSVGWLYNQMRTWISENFGPTLEKSQHAGIKVMALDDQRFFLPWFIDLIFENNKTKNYVDGIAVHWYWNKIFPASILTRTHEKYPDKFILGTEACKGDKPFEKHVDLGSWTRGEEYVLDIIQNLRNWVTGWIDWNMALDVKGGPTYIDNNVDSPIIVNASAGEFYKQPMYYGLGHFSKFLPKESVRIATKESNKKLNVVALQRQDGGIVVVVLNRNQEEIPVSILDTDKGVINIKLSANSFTTVIYW